ncbi:MAG: hypothetical protein ABIK18_06485 [candidate division WOR-3 bacterium]
MGDARDPALCEHTTGRLAPIPEHLRRPGIPFPFQLKREILTDELQGRVALISCRDI